MKQINLFSIIALFAIILSSCGGGGSAIKEKTIKASGISISGDGSDYIKVVDGDYILKVVSDKVVIAVKFELVKKYDGKSEPEMGNVNLIPLDKTGVAVPDLGLDFKPATMSDWDKIKDLLKGEVGKQATISFEWSYFSNAEIQERIMKETESFEITRADLTGGSSSEVSSSDESSNDESVSSGGSEDWDDEDDEEVVTKKSGSTNWDKVLADYESYTDKYIKLLKKANSGDMSAMTEYVSMLEKAQALQESLSDADDEMTPAQLQKFMKIQQKLINAASNL